MFTFLQETLNNWTFVYLNFKPMSTENKSVKSSVVIKPRKLFNVEDKIFTYWPHKL